MDSQGQKGNNSKALITSFMSNRHKLQQELCAIEKQENRNEEDQPAPKRRLSSTVVKMEEGEILEDDAASSKGDEGNKNSSVTGRCLTRLGGTVLTERLRWFDFVVGKALPSAFGMKWLPFELQIAMEMGSPIMITVSS